MGNDQPISHGAVMVGLRILVISLVVGLAFGRSADVAEVGTTTSKSPSSTTIDVTSTTSAGTSPADVTSLEPDDDDDDEERVSYEGAQLLRVDTQSTKVKEDILKLEDLGVLDTWNGMADNSPTVDVFVSPDNQMKLKTYLRENNVTYKIAIENIQRVIDAENPNVTSDNMTVATKQSSGHPMTWDAYHSLDDIYTYMDFIDQTHDHASMVTVGTSVEGRPIKAMKITYVPAGQPPVVDSEPAIFIDGGMHGREWLAVASAMYVMRELVENKDTYLALTSVSGLDTAWFFIIPVLNPDGYEYSRKKDRLWRKNRRKGTKKFRKQKKQNRHSYHTDHRERRCYGVDLNRNFGYKWGGAGSSSNECKETYRGAAALSEPETLAYTTFMFDQKGNDDGNYYHAVYLSLHSYGQSISYPWSYDRINHKNYDSLQGMANLMASKAKQVAQKTYKVGAFGATFYPASGTSADWFISPEPNFLYSYTVELRDNGRYGFLVPAHQIIPTGSEVMQMLLALFTN